MPFSRPTLTELRNIVAQDIEAQLPGSDALLRFSNLKITGDAQANLAHLHYGYLDYIALQSVPFTATDEYLEAWAALKRVYRKPAAQSTGSVTLNGSPGAGIATGVPLVRGDGLEYTTTSDGVVSADGSVTVNVVANADPNGETGANGNCPAGTILTLGTAIAGIQSNGVTGLFAGGADVESDDAFRARMIFAFQNPPQGGSDPDYIIWSREVPGVTRSWVVRNGFGAGTVVVYVMFDDSESQYDGFPQGSDGVATKEDRGIVATGDQLVVANHIYEVQPVTALVYVCAPVPFQVDFSILGIPVASQESVTQAIKDIFFAYGSPGGRVPISYIWSAISSVPGVKDFVIQSPSGDIICPAGHLPVIGEIDWL